MPIPVANIVSFMQADLDSEGSDRYLFDQDFKPAINGAIDIVVALFNQAFADKKLSPEQLRELVKVGIWQSNNYSRIAYKESEVGFPFWTIVAVYPKPITNNLASATVITDKSVSVFKKDISYIKSDYVAKRLTLEEWNDNKDNAFMPGNTLIQESTLSEFAYCDFADYGSASYTGNGDQPEITIRPDVSNELIAISFLKTPTKISLITDSLEFPTSLTQIITDIALNQISIKQGDQTTLFGITTQNVQRLIGLMK